MSTRIQESAAKSLRPSAPNFCKVLLKPKRGETLHSKPLPCGLLQLPVLQWQPLDCWADSDFSVCCTVCLPSSCTQLNPSQHAPTPAAISIPAMSPPFPYQTLFHTFLRWRTIITHHCYIQSKYLILRSVWKPEYYWPKISSFGPLILCN